MTDLVGSPTLLTPSQVAEHVQVSTKTVMRAIARSELRAARIGRRGAWRVRPEDVAGWLEARANRPRDVRVAVADPVSVNPSVPLGVRRRARSGRLELADI